MRHGKKAFSLFLALALSLSLSLGLSASAADYTAAAKHIRFDRDPVGAYEFPIRMDRWVDAANSMQMVDEVWTLYVFPDDTNFTYHDLPKGYTGFGVGWDGYQDGSFSIGGGMIETEFMGNTFTLTKDDMIWELGIEHTDEAANGVITEREICVTSASKAAQLPLRPVSGGAAEQPSGWAKGFVSEAMKAGIVPDALQSRYTQAATRGEFCALAVRLYETVTGRTVTDRAKFNDTNDVNVEKAAALGIIGGVGAGQAAPNGTITREQAAAMLARLAEACGKPLSSGNASFGDSAAISGWASGFVNQVGSSGIMGGTGDGNFTPQGQYTREQSITTMLNLFRYVQG